MFHKNILILQRGTVNGSADRDSSGSGTQNDTTTCVVCRSTGRATTPRPSSLTMARSLGRESLRLYRRFIRAAQRWHDDYESAWIRQEARKLFEEHRNETNIALIKDLQAAAERRLEVALHYKIPYERPEHFGGGGAEGLSQRKERAVLQTGRKRTNVNGATKWIS